MAEKQHKDDTSSPSSAALPSQPAIPSSRHHRASSPATVAPNSDEAHAQSSEFEPTQDPEDSYQGPSFVRDERKREKESGLDDETVNDNQGSGNSRSFDREQVWGPMGDKSSYPAGSTVARGRHEADDAGQDAAAPALSVDRRAMRSGNQVYGSGPKNPLEDFVGTNIVFHGTSSEGGVPRARRGAGRLHYMLAKANAGTGMLAGNETSAEGGGAGQEDEDKDKVHDFSWDKSWWGVKEWLIWLLACPIPTILIFINGFLGQDFFCAMIYMAFLVPLDVIGYYYDVYAYHDNDSDYMFFMTIFIILDVLLCICVLPAFAAWSMRNDERKTPLPGQGGNGGGYGATGFGGFQPFHGGGQSTGYGERTPTTQMV
mmetsp:Transcript_7541/g.17728  ORF Transcript_7541/g.17728 Transcript_7541/m.17728 type:complete len:372 (-) Transcript_7541:84-1199(-)